MLTVTPDELAGRECAPVCSQRLTRRTANSRRSGLLAVVNAVYVPTEACLSSGPASVVCNLTGVAGAQVV